MEKEKSDSRKRDTGDAGRCTKARSKKNYSKKRKYHGKNKQKKEDIVDAVASAIDEVTENVTQELTPDPVPVPKLIDINQVPGASDPFVEEEQSSQPPPSEIPPVEGYRFIDMSMLAEVFQMLGCPGCKAVNTLRLSDADEKKKDLARFLTLSCQACLYQHQFYTSKQVDPIPTETNKGGQRFYDVNVRTV